MAFMAAPAVAKLAGGLGGGAAASKLGATAGVQPGLAKALSNPMFNMVAGKGKILGDAFHRAGDTQAGMYEMAQRAGEGGGAPAAGPTQTGSGVPEYLKYVPELEAQMAQAQMAPQGPPSIMDIPQLQMRHFSDAAGRRLPDYKLRRAARGR